MRLEICRYHGYYGYHGCNKAVDTKNKRVRNKDFVSVLLREICEEVRDVGC